MVLEAYFSVSVFSLVVILLSALMYIWVFSFRKNLKYLAIPFFISLTIAIEITGTILVANDQKVVASILMAFYYASQGMTGWSIGIAFDKFAKVGLFKNAVRRWLFATPLIIAFPFYIFDLIHEKFALNVFSIEFGISGIAITVVMAVYLLFTGVFAFVSASKAVGSQKILFRGFGISLALPLFFMGVGFAANQGMEYRWFPYAMMVLLAVFFILRFKITLDGLTGIKNRSAFDVDIKDKVNNSTKYLHLYLMYCDINYFKKINDTYGHDAGDKALVLFAKTLHYEAETINADAYRLGGDEFCVIFSHQTKKEIDEFTRNVINKVSQTDVGFEFSFSVGLAKYRKGMSVTDFLNAADKEMYEQKHSMEALTQN
ncbi:MAG: diguanylate cyclase [Bacilli bacterium]|nr:diguanylate cyclase [Bacilli bacterium]